MPLLMAEEVSCVVKRPALTISAGTASSYKGGAAWKSKHFQRIAPRARTKIRLDLHLCKLRSAARDAAEIRQPSSTVRVVIITSTRPPGRHATSAVALMARIDGLPLTAGGSRHTVTNHD